MQAYQKKPSLLLPSVTASRNAHFFRTQFETYDELMRPITLGFEAEYCSAYEKLRINHYACQSYEYYYNNKRHLGFLDENPADRRSDDWWQIREINDHSDTAIGRFRDQVAKMVADIA